MTGMVLQTLLALGALILLQESNPPTLLISEVDYDPPGRDEVGEWVEIVYLGDEPLPLGDYKIGDEERMGQGEGLFRFPDDAIAAPGQVIVIARNAPAFRARFGANPDFEFYDADPAVPDMRPYRLWATGELFLANDGDELLLVGPDNVIRDTVNWGDSTYFFTPSVPLLESGQTLARLPADCDRDSAADWFASAAPTPGVVVRDGDCPVPEPQASPDVELTGPIGAIQGSGAASPYLGELVTFRGVVTGLQEHRNSRGAVWYTLFVQDDAPAADGDPQTSDAIAVFTATAHPSFQPGDALQVRGAVTEFYGLTEIDFRGLELTPLGRAPDGVPAPLQLTTLDPGSLEALEGMTVSLPAVRVAGATHTGCGFAVALPETELPLLHEDPLALPAPVLPVIYQSNLACPELPDVKRGDLIEGLAGILTYQFDRYQLVLLAPQALTITASPLPVPPSLPPAAAGHFMAVTLNVHDFFAADADLAARRTKVVRLLADQLGCPAVIALQEVENRVLLRELAAGLAEACGAGYDIAHQDGPDSRGLDVAFLAAADRVQIRDYQSHQACAALTTGIEAPQLSCPGGQSPLHGRPPLQIDTEIGGARYTFFVNHFKSKREGEVETAAWRLAQATHLAGLVAAAVGNAPDSAVLVMGDLNDLPFSAPVQALLAGGSLYDPLRELEDADRYTYVFGGYAELLDYILVSPATAIVNAGILHLNTDFPAGWAADPTLPFRTSDHDVPWVLVRLPAPWEPPAAGEVALPSVSPAPATLPPPSAAAMAPATPERAGPSLLMLSLGTAAVVGVAGGVLLWLRRRQ